MTKKGEQPTTDSRTATAASRYGVLAATKDGRFSRVAPPSGRVERNRLVLAELGLSGEEIARLEAEGIVIPPAS